MLGYFAPRSYRPKTEQKVAFSMIVLFGALAWGGRTAWDILRTREIRLNDWPVIAFPFLIALGAAATLLAALASRNDILIIDERGVTRRKLRSETVFTWGSIQKVRKYHIPDGDGGSGDVVAIQRFGELSHGADENSLEGFDVNADELLAAIHAAHRYYTEPPG